LLTKYLARNKKAVLGEIIATIQQEQNEVIRKKPQHNMIVQGAAGSGKTTVAMHRISYILYNYEQEFAPEDFYIVGSNQVLLNYITGVLPELNVYGVSQMTMEQLFVRLLYEDWDKSWKIKPVVKGVTPAVKGTLVWFKELENFCLRYEYRAIPREDVVIEKTGKVLLDRATIARLLKETKDLSRADKISRLTDYLMARLENELSGKYYSYTQPEKQKLKHYYETYFGKREWKGSVAELYEQFLKEEQEKDFTVEVPEGGYDVYDLASMAYLYKRIKEDTVIREAGHVVIDEAQDFGMMAYASLKYCLSKCTYTIMGDVAQNISDRYGLNDWTELRKLMLPGEFDYFGILQKSYRNTVEISEFATDILYHGSFPVYPVEPIIRHGEPVTVKKCVDFTEQVTQAEQIIKAWQSKGRIKEDTVIREAGHVVIDEAQDFGMMAYASLKYCLSKCTYTIMGDVAQNISDRYGLNDWTELRKLMLPGEFDYFGILQKSYRNTVEISEFATDILYHGSFPVYPVEPIIRHGEPVTVKKCVDFTEQVTQAEQIIKAWQSKGLDTIAVVCIDEAEAEKVTAALQGSVDLNTGDAGKWEIGEGVMVLPLKYTKGLEFDAVLIFNASEEDYPVEDGYVKQLYVAATRALHELTVLYRGKLTGLIVDPVSPEQKQRMRLAADAQKKPVKTVVKQAESEKTKEEIYRQRAQEAEKERVARERYGPKKIIVTRNSQGTTDGATPKKAGQSGGPESRRTGQPSPAKVYGAGNGNAGRATGRQEPRMVENNGEYGDMPDAKTLMPAGHSRIDCAVRMVMKGKGYVDLLSSYGTLRITPLAVDLFRICFAKGQCREFPKAAVTAAGDLRCTVRENPSLVEITAGYAQIRVDKKTGALTFLNTQGKILLTERSREPRQLGEKKNWSFFEWKKDEALIAGGIGAPKPLKIGNSAAYFSYGRADDRYPGLASSKGYEMIFPAGSRVLCCNIAMYGTYISMEETDIIDYYLRAK
ncbi:MAG: AAA family ATPase, partial [Waltera sp.]